MKLACARTNYGAAGVLHFVSRASQCAGGGRVLVEFAQDSPIRVCRKEHGSVIRARGVPGVRGPAGTIRLVDGPGRCAPPTQPNETAQSLPARDVLRFCARRGSNSLRWPGRCRDNEYAVLLPKRKRGAKPRVPVARDDRSATNEDTAQRLDLLANDSRATGRRPLRVTAIDDGATQGKVTLDESGNVTYDPAARLDRLKHDEVLTDRFGYTISDGVRRDRATATVEVGGENDAPQLDGIENTTLDAGSGAIPSAATPRVTDRIAVGDAEGVVRGATIQIATGFDREHNDTLRFTPQPGITGTYDGSTGTLSLQGTASPAAYQDALRSVVFTTDSDAPTSDRALSFRVDDGGPSNIVSRQVRVTNADASVTASPALQPAFAPGISDYVSRCTNGDPVDVSVDGPAGTTVSVDGQPAGNASVGLSEGQSFTFTVTRSGSSGVYHVRCLPADFPTYQATVTGKPQAQWYFVGPALGNTLSRYVAIFDNQGVPLWWAKRGEAPVDFKLLSSGTVGFFSGVPGSKAFEEFALDGTLRRSTVTVGTPTDSHDYQELPNGNRYLMSYRLRDHVDVSAQTGKPEDTDAAVLDAEVQEIAPDGSLVWSWNAATHIGLAETGRWWSNTPAKTADNRNLYDIHHINAIEPDGDKLILSMRHDDAVYRIDKDTGDIDWKLGGTHTADSLTVVGDDANAATDFGGQHDTRLLPDGTLALFDNATLLARRPRGVRFRIDRAARTATLVESIEDPDANGVLCCGSARKLPTGNWVVSWGDLNFVSELTPAGTRTFKLQFPPSVFTYRADPILPGRLSADAVRAGMDAQYPRP